MLDGLAEGNGRSFRYLTEVEARGILGFVCFGASARKTSVEDDWQWSLKNITEEYRQESENTARRQSRPEEFTSSVASRAEFCEDAVESSHTRRTSLYTPISPHKDRKLSGDYSEDNEVLDSIARATMTENVATASMAMGSAREENTASNSYQENASPTTQNSARGEKGEKSQIHDGDRLYAVVIQKRRCVGLVGPHRVYNLEAVQLVELRPNTEGAEASTEGPSESSLRQSAKKKSNPAEEQLRDMFLKVANGKDLYFSYTLDLTNTLQHNMTSLGKVTPPADGKAESDGGARPVPYYREKFAWNHNLLEALWKEASERDAQVTVEEEATCKPSSGLILPIIQGYFSQRRIHVYGRPITSVPADTSECDRSLTKPAGSH